MDILLAFSLATLFVVVITETSENAKNSYYSARDRSDLLDGYDAGILSSTTKLYGNERVRNVQKDLGFDSVSELPQSKLTDIAGTPLCSVDFMKPGSTPHITTVSLPINPQFVLSSIVVRDGVAYIAVDTSPVSGFHILVYDIRDPSHPVLLSGFNGGHGEIDLTLAGPYIYAAGNSTVGPLEIFKLSSTQVLTKIQSYRLPLPTATTSPPIGSTLFYDKGYIYFGTEKWDGDEFNIIDVSNPQSPVKISSLKIGSKVSTIYVENGYVYVGSSAINQLTLVDVHDPRHPFIASTYSPSGWQRQTGKSLNVFEGNVVFGRTSGGFDIPTDPEILLWGTSTAVNLFNPMTQNNPGGIYGLITDHSHIYALTRQAGTELQIYDKSLTASSSISIALPSQPQSMTCDRDMLYVLSHVAPSIYEVTFNK